jgi:hypothetical protein
MPCNGRLALCFRKDRSVATQHRAKVKRMKTDLHIGRSDAQPIPGGPQAEVVT